MDQTSPLATIRPQNPSEARLSNNDRHMKVRSLFSFSVLFASAWFAQAQAAKPVAGCELLNHPSRYNGQIVIVDGNDTWGFERSDITFACPGRIEIQVALTAADEKKYGFRTEQTSVDSMSQLPPGEHPGDNLTTQKLFQARVKVVGLFRCHYDFPTCKGASRDDGSIVVKSIVFETPIAEASF